MSENDRQTPPQATAVRTTTDRTTTVRTADRRAAEYPAAQRRRALLALNQSNLCRDSVCRLGAALDRWLESSPSEDAELSEILSVSRNALLEARAVVGEAAPLAEAQEAAARALGARIVTRLDTDYPQALFDLELPPPVVFARGVLTQAPGIAIVGPRNVDPYGLEATRILARDLSDSGLVVISGFARGVDITAHRAALEVPGGRTMAVLGCGLAARYPRQHYREAERIAQRGAVLSEFPCDFGPRARNFPIRNRLIAALSVATLVVQASLKSGSLITARCALDLGREVLAVPGRIFDRRSMGANALLRDGAHVALEARSVIEILPSKVQDQLERAKSEAQLNLPGPAGERALLAQQVRVELELRAQSVEQLSRGLEAPIGSVLASLLELEIAGEVRRNGAEFSIHRR